MLDTYLNSILQGDCISVMQQLPQNSIDLIFADPPYNLQLNQNSTNLNRPQGRKVDGVNDEWDKFSSFQEYDQFTQNWLQECHRILKPNGTIWISGTYHNIFRIGKMVQDLGFWILNDVAWVKSNPMPHFLGRRFCASYETLIWAVKEQGANYTFNYQTMKDLNGGFQMRSDWRIPICQGNERIKIEGKKAHSTQKPEALLYRIILACTNLGDTILDPFFGTGTTGAVAKRLRRNYIGIEQNSDYVAITQKRISQMKPYQKSVFENTTDSKAPDIPFGALIEKGMVIPGTFLHSPCGQKKARVLANSHLRHNRKTGSIHSLCRQISGMDGMNGWEYWQVKLKDRHHKFISINFLRKLYEVVCLENEGKTTKSTEINYPIWLYKIAQIGGFLSENELEKFKNLILEEYQNLNERGRRLYAARQVLDFGWGGQRYVADFLGMSRDTIRRGIGEIQKGETLPIEKQRKT